MNDDKVKAFLKSQKGEVKTEPPEAQDIAMPNQWDEVIIPGQAYLVIGDKRMGKSALCHWIMENYSKKYNLIPVVVGLPREKQSLLPPNFVMKDTINECAEIVNTVVFVDEAGLQLPLDDAKCRDYVVNLLSLAGQRQQILLLAFHFPRLALARYLPFFDGFLLKRPPYLLEFASKGKNDMLYQMMVKAEARFADFIQHSPPTEAEIKQVKGHTFVVAPRLRWTGLLENPMPSFWTQELSLVWAGTSMKTDKKSSEPIQSTLPVQGEITGWHSDDPGKALTVVVTPEMEGRAIERGGIDDKGNIVPEPNYYGGAGYVVMEDPFAQVRWLKRVY